jgi:hypothetical protein
VHPEPVAEPSPKLSLAALVVRVAGLGVLVGGLAKLLLGTPADLPRAVLDLGFGMAPTYQAVITIELLVTALALVVPWLAWPVLVAMLATFLVILGTQLAAGAESCGCFGGNIKVPPLAMLLVDAALLALLLVSAPWRLRRTGLRLPWLLPLFAVAALTPWWVLQKRQAATAPGMSRFTILEPHKWVGQELEKSELGKLVTADALATLPFDGRMIFYSQTCEHCARYLERLARDKSVTDLITLIRVPNAEEKDPKKIVVHIKPQVAAEIALPEGTDWTIHVPTELILENSVIKSARVIIPD